MKIARYWVKSQAEGRLPSGGAFPVVAWGWSQNSREEAAQRANEAAARAAQWLAANWRRRERGQYYALERPPREEIVREISDASGAVVATITRNSYGSLVLNTARLMFIDVDVPAETALAHCARKVLGRLGRHSPSPGERVQKRIEQCAEYSHHTIRLYRTAAGFRCMVIDRPIDATSPESRALLETFGADPLYVKICRSQECYRARLTPKFWRCEAGRPPHRFPWQSAREEREQRRWEEQYERRCKPFAVCRFVAQFGNRTAAELQPLLELHDQYVRAKSDQELA